MVVEEIMLEALRMKNRLLPHLGCLKRFSLTRMLTESSLGSNLLGSLVRMPFERYSPSLPKFSYPFPPPGPNLWPARIGTKVQRTLSIGRRSTLARG